MYNALKQLILKKKNQNNQSNENPFLKLGSQIDLWNRILFSLSLVEIQNLRKSLKSLSVLLDGYFKMQKGFWDYFASRHFPIHYKKITTQLESEKILFNQLAQLTFNNEESLKKPWFGFTWLMVVHRKILMKQ